jgi:predicted AlkP superfamily pyrophosphatase or phosphodiesterase
MSKKTIPDYVVIISLDGLSTLDYEIISNLPNFKEYLTGASYCKKVYTIYPSLTYPAHTTIITGKYPKNHGIINNTLLQPERKKADWYWYRKYIKGDTLYDKAIDKGLKTAALLWPVTGRSEIQLNMPEIFANRPWQNQVTVSLLSGSPAYQFLLNSKFGHLRKGKKEPELDNFVHQCVLYTIEKKRPNLMLIHYTDLDAQRHHHGFHSKEALEALNRHDKRLGEIMSTLKNEGLYDNSAIIVLGDHSSLDEDKIIRPNILLKKHSFLVTDKKNKIKSWEAISKNCDGSSYIYLRDKDSIKTIQKVSQQFSNFLTNPLYYDCKDSGIEAIYTSSEAASMGADPNCALMLEAKKGYYFSDEIEGDLIEKLDFNITSGTHYTRATHGYSPFKSSYTTMFLASGKGIRSGVIVEKMNLVDEAPTLAKLMNLELDNTDGKPINELLEI